MPNMDGGPAETTGKVVDRQTEGGGAWNRVIYCA